jgi:hypothetical protein
MITSRALASCRRRALALLALAWAVGVAPTVGAAEVALTLLGGLHVGGSFEDAVTGSGLDADVGPSFGAALGFDLGGDRTLEVMWVHQQLVVPDTSHQAGDVDLDVDTLGVGGTFEWGGARARPFVSGTAGVALLSPENSSYDRELLLMASLGVGVKLPLSSRTSIRLEGRGVGMFVVSGAAGICGPGGCALGFSGSGLGQLELLAGISFRF